MPVRGFVHFKPHEEESMRRWAAEGRSPSEIADLLDRDLSTIARRMKRLASKKRVAPEGRPRLLSPKDEARVVRTAERMVRQADGEWQVTADMIKKALKLKCCVRVVLDALHRNGVRFRPMRQKPVLTEEDVKDRLAFAVEYANKPVSFWEDKVHAYMDNKFFTPYLTAKARAYARKLRPRGTYRAQGQGLGHGHVKPRKDLRQNFGRSVHVSVAISAAKVLMCNIVKGNWNSASAASMYKDVLGPALRKAHPRRHKFLILEDNDPAGYKSQLAKDAKAEMGVTVLELPKRSPALNPLDFAFWTEVNARLRKQEEKFGDGYKETQCHFAKRLRRTVLGVRAPALRSMVRHMKRRCELLREAKGWHFEEGS